MRAGLDTGYQGCACVSFEIALEMLTDGPSVTCVSFHAAARY